MDLIISSQIQFIVYLNVFYIILDSKAFTANYSQTSAGVPKEEINIICELIHKSKNNVYIKNVVHEK